MLFRTILIAGALSTTLIGTAFAQDIILAPEDEVVVREYVVKQPRAEVVIPDGYSVVVGEPVPETVTVTPLDAPGFSKQLEYVVIGDDTVLVDPETRRVVKVLN